MTDALKPCPFCGSDDVEALDMEGKHYVVCYDCALEGPFHKSRAAVIAAWNTRAALAAPAVPPGWQLVPVEPTEAMLAAFLGYKPKDDSWLEGYRAMLAAVIVGSRTS